MLFLLPGSTLHKMSLLWSVFLNGAGTLLALFVLWLGCAVYYHFSSTDVPPGICQPLKFTVLNIMYTMATILDHAVWKMGICRRFKVLRSTINGIPPRDDPMLHIENALFEGVHVRIYFPKQPLIGHRRGIVFMHGGGGIVGSIEAHERLCRYIAKESDSVVVSVGYRLSPEHPHPTLFNECRSAIVYFMRNAGNYGVDSARIILAGESIGGTATAYLCQELRMRTDLPRVRAQVLLYPLVQMIDFNLPSYQQNRNIGIQSREQFLTLGLQYLNIQLSLHDLLIAGSLIPTRLKMTSRKWVNPDIISQELGRRKCNPDPYFCLTECLSYMVSQMLDPKLSPLLVTDSVIKELPETFILTCEYDILRDDGLLYKKRLEDNGIKVTYHNLVDGFHGCLTLINHWMITFPCAKTGSDYIVNYIKRL